MLDCGAVYRTSNCPEYCDSRYGDNVSIDIGTWQKNQTLLVVTDAISLSILFCAKVYHAAAVRTHGNSLN